MYVCVCVHHENVKLMLNEIYIQHLTEYTDMMLDNYHDCLDAIVCPDSSSSCHLGECENCPGTENLNDNMVKAFEEHRINEVKFEILLQAKRYTLKTLVIDTDEFPDDFCERFLRLKTHHFGFKGVIIVFHKPGG